MERQPLSQTPRNDTRQRGDGKRRRVLRAFVHSLRVALFLIIVWLIHAAHQQRTQHSQPADLSGVSADVVRQIYGDGAQLEQETGAVADAAGASLGRLLQTSPQSAHIIGFSGPTNLLIAFDNDEAILDVRVLSSEDTKEHVRQVQDAGFLNRFVGRTKTELAKRPDVDAVSGATLTSLAMLESILHRLGAGLESLKFPGSLTREEMRPLFPDVASMQPDPHDSSWWNLADDGGRRIGSLLRTSPAADNIVGYQGPTETLIGFDRQGNVIGIVVGESYDNDPYVGYVQEDSWFRNSFNGRTLKDLAELDLEAAGVEGVSGATMTSMAVADGMVAAADHRTERQSLDDSNATDPIRISVRNWGTIAVLIAGLVIGLTNLRGKRWVRIPFQCVLVGYLGFVNGDLLSQAVLVGWAKNGIPWETMLGLALLSAAALLLPITTKQNVYCHQLCPHGAAQQWLRPRGRRHLHLPRRLERCLSLIPGGLLLLVVAVAMGAVSLSLVDLEPFDAYLITIAGAATITIAVVGLIASAFVPMAYCRYGCPTGALLEYLRRHARSERLTARDAIAVACLLLAWTLHAA